MEGNPSTDELTLQRRRAVAASVGQLNQEWAYLELTIDGCIVALHHFFAGSELEKYRPRAFAKKINYMCNGAENLPQMNFVAPYIPLLKRLKELGDARNWLVHGHLAEVSEEQSLKFVRHSMKSDLPSLEQKVYYFNEIYSFTVEIHNLAKVMRELMDTLLSLTDIIAGHKDA